MGVLRKGEEDIVRKGEILAGLPVVTFNFFSPVKQCFQNNLSGPFFLVHKCLPTVGALHHYQISKIRNNQDLKVKGNYWP